MLITHTKRTPAPKFPISDVKMHEGRWTTAGENKTTLGSTNQLLKKTEEIASIDDNFDGFRAQYTVTQQTGERLLSEAEIREQVKNVDAEPGGMMMATTFMTGMGLGLTLGVGSLVAAFAAPGLSAKISSAVSPTALGLGLGAILVGANVATLANRGKYIDSLTKEKVEAGVKTGINEKLVYSGEVSREDGKTFFKPDGDQPKIELTPKYYYYGGGE